MKRLKDKEKSYTLTPDSGRLTNLVEFPASPVAPMLGAG